MVDVLTIYPCHSVNSIDTWYLVCNMMLVLYQVPGISSSLGKRVSFYRLIVSLSFYRYRYRYTELVSARYFLPYRFQTIIPKLPVRYPPHSYPPFFRLHFHYFLVHFSDCPCILVAFAQITPSTYKRESGPMLSGVGNDTHQTTSQSGLPPLGREGHFFPINSTVYSSSFENIKHKHVQMSYRL